MAPSDRPSAKKNVIRAPAVSPSLGSTNLERTRRTSVCVSCEPQVVPSWIGFVGGNRFSDVQRHSSPGASELHDVAQVMLMLTCSIGEELMFVMFGVICDISEGAGCVITSKLFIRTPWIEQAQPYSRVLKLKKHSSVQRRAEPGSDCTTGV